MLSFIKKLFGSKTVETPAPYKIEAPATTVEDFPFPATKQTVKKATTRPAKSNGGTKPAVKAKATRKPRAPKA